MRRNARFLFSILCFVIGVAFIAATAAPDQKPDTTTTANQSQIKRGEYLVTVFACHDCHSPKKFTDEGPLPDETRLLSGHPDGGKIPEIPKGAIGPNAWGGLMTNDLTAWAGPWGVSFPINLTPDMETGIGSWTEEMFMNALRTGKHLGAPDGRPILPPMPWQMYRHATDEDLKAIFAYLKSLKPIRNAVPDPLPPAGQ